MILPANSALVRVLCFAANPTRFLPQLFPLCVMHVRVGTNTTDFVRVSFE